MTAKTTATMAQVATAEARVLTAVESAATRNAVPKIPVPEPPPLPKPPLTVTTEAGSTAQIAKEVGGQLGKAAKNVAPRPLTVADLGVKGTLQELKGSFAVENGVANVRVDMIRGEISNPFEIIKNLSNTARAQGASSLRIEATLANEQLYNVLVKRYGLVTEGGKDIITIQLK